MDRLRLSQGFRRATVVFIFFLLNIGVIKLSHFNYQLKVTKLKILKLFATFSLASKSLSFL